MVSCTWLIFMWKQVVVEYFFLLRRIKDSLFAGLYAFLPRNAVHIKYDHIKFLGTRYLYWFTRLQTIMTLEQIRWISGFTFTILLGNRKNFTGVKLIVFERILGITFGKGYGDSHLHRNVLFVGIKLLLMGPPLFTGCEVGENVSIHDT